MSDDDKVQEPVAKKRRKTLRDLQFHDDDPQPEEKIATKRQKGDIIIFFHPSLDESCPPTLRIHLSNKQSIDTHWQTLCEASLFWAKQKREALSPEMDIKGYPPEVVMNMIECITPYCSYNCLQNLPNDQLFRLIKLAHSFEMNELVDQAVWRMKFESASDENKQMAFDCSEFACQARIQNLYTKAWSYFENHHQVARAVQLLSDIKISTSNVQAQESYIMTLADKWGKQITKAVNKLFEEKDATVEEVVKRHKDDLLPPFGRLGETMAFFGQTKTRVFDLEDNANALKDAFFFAMSE